MNKAEWSYNHTRWSSKTHCTTFKPNLKGFLHSDALDFRIRSIGILLIIEEFEHVDSLLWPVTTRYHLITISVHTSHVHHWPIPSKLVIGTPIVYPGHSTLSQSTENKYWSVIGHCKTILKRDWSATNNTELWLVSFSPGTHDARLNIDIHCALAQLLLVVVHQEPVNGHHLCVSCSILKQRFKFSRIETASYIHLGQIDFIATHGHHLILHDKTTANRNLSWLKSFPGLLKCYLQECLIVITIIHDDFIRTVWKYDWLQELLG